jgi:hypothetical protein
MAKLIRARLRMYGSLTANDPQIIRAASLVHNNSNISEHKVSASSELHASAPAGVGAGAGAPDAQVHGQCHDNAAAWQDLKAKQMR